MAHDLARDVTIAAPPDLVWHALVDADELKKWFVPDARVTPGAGGEIWLSWGEGMAGASRIEAWEPGRRLRTSSEGATIEWKLEARNGGTELHLVQSGIGSEAEQAALAQGWTVYLYNLKHMLERHPGEPGGLRYAFVPAPGSAMEIWQRFAEAISTEPLALGRRVSLGSTRGEVVLASPGDLLGIRLEDPADALLHLLFVSGAVMTSLHLFGTDPAAASNVWSEIVLLVGEE